MSTRNRAIRATFMGGCFIRGYAVRRGAVHCDWENVQSFGNWDGRLLLRRKLKGIKSEDILEKQTGRFYLKKELVSDRNSTSLTSVL